MSQPGESAKINNLWTLKLYLKSHRKKIHYQVNFMINSQIQRFLLI